MRVLITGAGGMLASSLISVLKSTCHLVLTGHQLTFESDLPYFCWDIRDIRAPQALFENYQFDTILHCAAFTKVDLCEAQQELAYEVNVQGTENILALARFHGARFFYVSTDYVFDGKKESPYVEDDQPCPANIYGRTKWEGEKLALFYFRSTVVRISWLFGGGKIYHNFVNTMVNLAENRGEPVKVVTDQVGKPTYTETVADVVKRFLMVGSEQAQKQAEIFHVVNQEPCSWYEFALAIFKAVGSSREIIPVKTSAFKRPALRPANSVLSTEKLEKKLHVALPSWRECLQQYLNSYYK